uniref:Ig-like domain-containing protein n=1 Tax=Chrysemys picta bellii TaxID=8478 RepID=A0A8C3HX56_CHRPI
MTIRLFRSSWHMPFPDTPLYFWPPSFLSYSKMLMGSTPLIVSLNDNISIPCKISGYNTAELDSKNVGVTWYLKTPRTDQEEKVFTFHAGAHISHRNGASMSDSDLRRGNAALSLLQIQFKEAGIYRCYVIVAPSDAHGTAVLEVVAQPEVSLSPKEVTIESDKEKTLSCEVNKFYPNLVDIKWMKISKNNQDSSVAAEDIHTGASVENEDGTFNVTSILRLQPSLQDNGNVYRCIVSHKTFPAKLLLNSTLTVTGIHSHLGSYLLSFDISCVPECYAESFHTELVAVCVCSLMRPYLCVCQRRLESLAQQEQGEETRAGGKGRLSRTPAHQVASRKRGSNLSHHQQ